MIVEDISTGTFTTLNKSAVNISVLADGVFINSPLNNSTSAGQVTVTASARESTTGIWQLQVWDASTGAKLGQSPANTSTINQTFTLARGTHKLVVEDIATGTFQALHKAIVVVQVP